VLSLQNGIVITGSDKKIKLWFRGEQQKEIEAHTDCIRSLVEVPDLNAFASGSNDCTVKLWSMDGTHLADFKGHTGFVYSVDCLESGELVSASDDCTVRVWKADTANCIQTIQLPSSAWSITHNKKGDLLIGC
jgi:phospholipase A-2-activating protein